MAVLERPESPPRSPAARNGPPAPGLVALGVTLYRPGPGQVERVVAHAAEGYAAVIAFDDGGLSAADAARLDRAGATVLSQGRNVGIAAALNRIAEAARATGAEHLLLLDQDAEPPPGLAAALLAARGAPGAAPIAVVGPSPEAAPGHKAPACPPRPGAPARDGLAPVQFLATSGSLIDLGAFEAVGPFREDFFIDGVELEWCFRAWAAGYGCYRAETVAIPHRVGGGVIRALGVATPRQPLFRMATYLRNAVYAWRLPHVPLGWKLRQAAYLPLQTLLYWADSGWRPAVLLRLLAALRDGALGRLGPPEDLGPGAR